jgi:hypothetical protein
MSHPLASRLDIRPLGAAGRGRRLSPQDWPISLSMIICYSSRTDQLGGRGALSPDGSRSSALFSPRNHGRLAESIFSRLAHPWQRVAWRLRAVAWLAEQAVGQCGEPEFELCLTGNIGQLVDHAGREREVVGRQAGEGAEPCGPVGELRLLTVARQFRGDEAGGGRARHRLRGCRHLD